MANEVKMISHSAKVLVQLEENRRTALEAMGIKAVSMIVNQMQKGYHKPIWRTGDLQRDVSYAVENSGPGTVDVGNTLDYSIYVHEGTSRMQARPYISDALTSSGARDKLKSAANRPLKKGF